MICAMCVRDRPVALCRWPGRYVLLCMRCRLRIREAIAAWIEDRKQEIEAIAGRPNYPEHQAPRRRSIA